MKDRVQDIADTIMRADEPARLEQEIARLKAENARLLRVIHALDGVLDYRAKRIAELLGKKR